MNNPYFSLQVCRPGLIVHNAYPFVDTFGVLANMYNVRAHTHTHTHPNKLRIGGRITEKGALQFIHMTLEHTGQDVASCMRVCEGQDLEHRYELAVGAGEVASALILYGVLLGQAQ